MDAVEFIQEEIRMCANFQDCTECPLCDTAYCSVSPKKRMQEEAEEIVRRIKDWSTANPRKTRQDLFLEQYPDVSLSYGIINIKPCQIVRNHTYGECCITDCPQCRKEFWTQEVK